MATENGPCGMYRLKCIYDCSTENIELPTNMYSLPNIYGNSTANEKEEKEDESELLNVEKQQIQLLDKLQSLKTKLLEMKSEINIELGEVVDSTPRLADFTLLMNQSQDIVINADPNYPPLSVWILCRLLKLQSDVMFNTHIHSSITSLPENVKLLKGDETQDNLRTKYQIIITLIWKDVGKDPEMIISPIMQRAIKGEVNIARYLARLLKPSYDSGDPFTVTEIDGWLDLAHCSVLHGNNKERQFVLRNMNSRLGKKDYLVGDDMTVADIVMWSALCQTKLTTGLSTNVNKWWKELSLQDSFVMPNEFLF